MLLSKTLVTAATTEPVTVDEVKASARLDSDITELDSQIELLIKAFRARAEQLTCREFVSQTWRLDYSDWPTGDIPLSPVSGLTSVEYFDGVDWQAATSSFTLFQTIEGRGAVIQTDESLPALPAMKGPRVRVTVEIGHAERPAGVTAWIIAQCVHAVTGDAHAKPPVYLDGLLDAQLDWQ